jgi:hypothetical protein
MKIGDKVICVDATPLPNFAPRDLELSEFVFPQGYIEEGAVYCVAQVMIDKKGHLGLFLVGKSILFRDSEVGWFSGRFRSLEEIQQRKQTATATKSLE